MIRATAFLLLLQAAAYQQAALNKNAEAIITGAAQSVEDLLELDYQVVKPMFKDIGLMKARLVDLMPYLEEAERPVITKAYSKLLDLEGTVKVDFGTPLGLLAEKATKESRKMKDKIEKYPGKFRSSLRTLRSFLSRVSTNVDHLTEASENALTHAKTVLISVKAFKSMMNTAKSGDIQTQTFQSFIELTDITQTIESEDPTWREAFSFVNTLIPKLVSFGTGLYQIFDTPDLRGKVDEIIEKNDQIVKNLRDVSLGLNKAKESLKMSTLAVADLKDNSDNYNPENIDTNPLKNKFVAISKPQKRWEGLQPMLWVINRLFWLSLQQEPPRLRLPPRQLPPPLLHQPPRLHQQPRPLPRFLKNSRQLPMFQLFLWRREIPFNVQYLNRHLKYMRK